MHLVIPNALAPCVCFVLGHLAMNNRHSCFALIIACFCAIFLATPETAFAFDEFDTLYAPPRFALHHDNLTLEIKGRARIGLHDLQGEGGPGYDSPTDTATIGTRSPFVELDSFDLAFRLNWLETLWLNTNISFLTDSTSLSAIYFEYRDEINDWYSHGLEVGYLSPVIATDRRTARYPLIALNYWKNPDYHVAYGAKFMVNDDISFNIYASAGFMRPLRLEPIHGSPTYAGAYSTLAYGSSTPYSGNSASGTLYIKFLAHGFSLEGFGHIGQIVTKKGIDTLVSSYTNYRSLDDFDPGCTDSIVWWAGGRLAYNNYGVHIMAEAIASQEQHIQRTGMYAQAGYTFTRDSDYFNTFELLARFDALWTLGSTKVQKTGVTLRSTDINNAITWDHHIITLAARANIIEDILSLRLEYSFFLEKNGVPDLGYKDISIDDNELLLQIEARY